MDLSHFHLQVKDMSESRRFYEELFGFREDFVCDENEVFLRNAHDFVLGLEKVEKPESLPSWFHFGFGCQSESEIRGLYDTIGAKRAQAILRELKDFGDTLNFYCVDPTGNKIEIYFNRK